MMDLTPIIFTNAHICFCLVQGRVGIRDAMTRASRRMGVAACREMGGGTEGVTRETADIGGGWEVRDNMEGL